MMSSVNKTLEDRGSRYGEFIAHASITQSLKDIAHETANWERLRDPHKEALDMIFHKIGRILNGDPEYTDSWHDISGYATLAEKECIDKVNINL
jgi:hypothetical protein